VDWVAKMLDAANKLHQVEDAYYKSIVTLYEERHICHEREGDLIAANKVNMKNEMSRQADLWKLAKDERRAVLRAEVKVDELKAELHYRQNLFEAICIAAKLSGK